MPEFDFRLRVNLPSYRFGSSEEVVLLGELPDGRTLRMRGKDRGLAIKDSDRVALLAGPYESEDEAHSAATETRASFLQWALTNIRRLRSTLDGSTFGTRQLRVWRFVMQPR